MITTDKPNEDIALAQKRRESIESQSAVSIGDDDRIQSLKIHIAWRDLKLIVEDREKSKACGDVVHKEILHGLNGWIRWGQMMMVIGPSGSGKTSFLNCISQLAVGEIQGDILFNGRPQPANAKRFVGVVQQNDIFFNSLTVRETLEFASALKLPSHFTPEERTERIESIIEDLDLVKCADTVIGEIGAGISGGERRRLSIGLELIHEPAVLLLDEPTTGLDSASALLIGKILRRLVDRKDVTVIATIHQPRLQLAKMFDKVYFLAQGREMYQGVPFPDLIFFLGTAGYAPEKLENPLDFVLDLVNTSDAEGSDKESREMAMDNLNKAYRNSDYYKEAADVSLPENFNTDEFFEWLSRQPMFITGFMNQWWVVMKRTFLFKLREPLAVQSQLFSAIFVNFIFGTIYWQIDLSIQSSYDRLSAISLVMLMMAFETFDILMLFPKERSLLNRECDAGLYGTVAYFIGRVLSEMPVHSFMGVIAGSITYWMFGLQNDGHKFGIFLAASVLCVNAGSGALMICSAIAKELEQSNLFATFIMVFMIFDGNWISLDKVPVYYRWIKHINFIAYSTTAAMVNEYEGLTFTCTASEAAINACPVAGFTLTGKQILAERGLENVDITFNLWMLLVLLVGYRIVACICLMLLFRTKPARQIISEAIGACFGG